MKNALILKYGELALRGKNRYLFENRLITQIRRSVNSFSDAKYSIIKEQGRILVMPDDSNFSDDDIASIIPRLKMIIGLIGICPCVKIENNDIANLQQTALEYMKEYYGGLPISFKVETKRADKKYPLSSLEISSLVGGYVLNATDNLTVNVKNPDVILYLELRNYTYIYAESEKGIGGLPVGSSGRGLLLLSGGIDSPVAGFLAAKRGVEIEAVYFHSPPYTSERAKLKVTDLAQVLAQFTGSIKLHIVPFTDVQLFLRDNVPEDKLTVFLKRAMLKISQEIAEANKCKVLINGDSIGQVASQNLSSMVAIGSAATIPLIRPLAGFDKQEIIDLAIKLGTYNISIRPYDDCCTLFVAKHPELTPKLSIVEKIESGLDLLPGLIAYAVANIETVVQLP